MRRLMRELTAKADETPHDEPSQAAGPAVRPLTPAIAIGPSESMCYSASLGRVAGIALSIHISIATKPRTGEAARPIRDEAVPGRPMNHVVFISHSTKDKAIARRVLQHLEQAGIRCWMADRDQHDHTYAAGLADAVKACRCFVLMFSGNAQESHHVLTELGLAFNHDKLIYAVRLDETTPKPAFEYFLTLAKWSRLQTLTRTQDLESLVASVKEGLEISSAAKRARAPWFRRVMTVAADHRVLPLLVAASLCAGAALAWPRLHHAPPPDLVVVGPFADEVPAGSEPSAGALESLLCLQILAGGGHLRVVPRAVFESKAEGSQGTPPLRIGGALRPASEPQTVTLRLWTSAAKDTQAFVLRPMEILSPTGSEDALRDIHRWLLEQQRWTDVRVQSGLAMRRYLTRVWRAYERYCSGLRCWESHNAESAAGQYRNALGYDPRFVMAKARLAEASAFLGDWDEARTQMLEARDILSHDRTDHGLCNVDTLVFQALYAQLVDQNPHTEEVMRGDLLNLTPYHPDAYYNEGEVFFHTARWPEAVKRFDMALSFDPAFMQALNHRAYCRAYVGDFAAARADLKTYLDLVGAAASDQANAHDTAGDIEALSGNYVEALGRKEMACAASTANYMALSKIKVLLLMGRDSQARAESNRLLQELAHASDRNAEVDARTYLAIAACQEGQLDASLAQLDPIWPLYGNESSPSDSGRVRLSLRFLDTGDTNAFVFRDILNQERWVKPLWLRGVIAYELGDRELLQDIVSFLDTSVIQPETLTGEIYRPICKLQAHLKLLLSDLAGCSQTELAAAILKTVEDRNRWSYWTTYHDRSYFLTELARLSLNRDCPEVAESLLAMVSEHNPHFVPARWLAARIASRHGERAAARDTLEAVQRDLEAWNADPDGYLWQGTRILAEELESSPLPAFEGAGPVVGL